VTPDILPPKEILTNFGCSEAKFIVETERAKIWKVVQQNGQQAALKIYRAKGMGNEAAGFDFLAACDGRAAAFVLDRQGNAALLEWLDGPSLGDMTRSGNDRHASILLADVAKSIHSIGVLTSVQLPLVSDWLDSLLNQKIDQRCPADAQRDFVTAQRWASDLLESGRDWVPLHGDLHHDNVRLGSRGYCAFDAKGVIGERAYELANSFRNPNGAEKLMRSPDRINAHANIISGALNVDRARLLRWAAVKSALSISWGTKGKLREHAEFDLLGTLISVSRDSRRNRV